jgi:hypothetical protein
VNYSEEFLSMTWRKPHHEKTNSREKVFAPVVCMIEAIIQDVVPVLSLWEKIHWCECINVPHIFLSHTCSGDIFTATVAEKQQQQQLSDKKESYIL